MSSPARCKSYFEIESMQLWHSWTTELDNTGELQIFKMGLLFFTAVFATFLKISFSAPLDVSTLEGQIVSIQFCCFIGFILKFLYYLVIIHYSNIMQYLWQVKACLIINYIALKCFCISYDKIINLDSHDSLHIVWICMNFLNSSAKMTRLNLTFQSLNTK